MSPKMIVGVVLLVGGVLLLYMGYQETQTIGGSLSSAFGGGMSDKALMLLGGGGVAAVLGLLSILRAGR